MSRVAVDIDWSEDDEPKTARDPSAQRTALANAVSVLVPADLLWLRTTVEQELLRRGFTSIQTCSVDHD